MKLENDIFKGAVELKTLYRIYAINRNEKITVNKASILQNIFLAYFKIIKVKVKVFRYKPGAAVGVPGG
jgi:hypothetical protein